MRPERVHATGGNRTHNILPGQSKYSLPHYLAFFVSIVLRNFSYKADRIRLVSNPTTDHSRIKEVVFLLVIEVVRVSEERKRADDISDVSIQRLWITINYKTAINLFNTRLLYNVLTIYIPHYCYILCLRLCYIGWYTDLGKNVINRRVDIKIDI